MMVGNAKIATPANTPAKLTKQAALSVLLDNTLTKLANRLAPTALLENTPAATPSEIMTRPAIAHALREDT